MSKCWLIANKYNQLHGKCLFFIKKLSKNWAILLILRCLFSINFLQLSSLGFNYLKQYYLLMSKKPSKKQVIYEVFMKNVS